MEATAPPAVAPVVVVTSLLHNSGRCRSIQASLCLPAHHDTPLRKVGPCTPRAPPLYWQPHASSMHVASDGCPQKLRSLVDLVALGQSTGSARGCSRTRSYSLLSTRKQIDVHDFQSKKPDLSVGRSVGRSVSRSVGRSVGRLVGRSVGHSAELPALASS